VIQCLKILSHKHWQKLLQLVADILHWWCYTIVTCCSESLVFCNLSSFSSFAHAYYLKVVLMSCIYMIRCKLHLALSAKREQAARWVWSVNILVMLVKLTDFYHWCYGECCFTIVTPNTSLVYVLCNCPGIIQQQVVQQTPQDVPLKVQQQQQPVPQQPQDVPQQVQQQQQETEAVAHPVQVGQVV